METSIQHHRSLVAAVAVAFILALLSTLQLAIHRQATDYLLLPPLAVIAYLIFRNRLENSAKFRSIVVLPFLAAVIGELCWHYLGLTPAGVAVATFAVLIVQAAMRADMPPALALAILAMLLRAQGPDYLIGVLGGTSTIFITFWLWQHLSPCDRSSV